MKILIFTKYTRKGASSRLRSFQFEEYLRTSGIEVVYSSFFSDKYLDEVYKKKTHNKLEFLRSIIKRAFQLFGVFRYDKLVIEKELFPYMPAIAERILSLVGIKFMVDYDDAIFHNYDQSKNPIIRKFLSKKIQVVMRLAEVVIVGNEYLRSKAIEFNAKNVVIIPTSVDVKKYRVRPPFSNENLIIGWIGSPITAKYLPFLKDTFTQLHERFKIKLRWIGAGSSLGMGEFVEVLDWNEDREATDIMSFDVGIMPLTDNIWERGKCGYKLIQYMACGIPVVGTPIGINDSIIQNGVNGFKATSIHEWKSALETLLSDPGLRTRMGLAGRSIVEQEYSTVVAAKAWTKIFSEY